MSVEFKRRGDVTDTYVNGNRIPSWVIVAGGIIVIFGVAYLLASL